MSYNRAVFKERRVSKRLLQEIHCSFKLITTRDLAMQLPTHICYLILLACVSHVESAGDQRPVQEFPASQREQEASMAEAVDRRPLQEFSPSQREQEAVDQRPLQEFLPSQREQEETVAEAVNQFEAEQRAVKRFEDLDSEVSRSGTTIDQHRQFTFTTLASINRGQQNRPNVIRLQKAIRKKDVPISKIPELLEMGLGPKLICNESFSCDIKTPYRTMDGRCNNLINTTWGMASISFRRWLYAAYNDGIATPRQRRDPGSGPYLPSARTVSTSVHIPSATSDEHKKFTHILMQWGQFLDHDITSTPTQQLTTPGGYGSTAVTCCRDIVSSQTTITQSELDSRPECFPIQIVQPDRHFKKIKCMNFIRSVQVENANCQTAPVEQLNEITAYIDASNVYGSSLKESKILRTFSNGLLKARKNHLPEDEDQPASCTTPRSFSNPSNYCFRAGDHRVNENPTLQSMHTIFMREHNRIARALKKLNCHWGDGKLFQESRKIVGAIMQKITYGEYLPIILGTAVMKKHGLNVASRGYTNSYSNNVDASIRNAFATAAFRMGHSMIQSHLGSRTKHYKNAGDDMLSTVFGNTNQILTKTDRTVDHYSRGLVSDRIQNVDRKMTREVTDLLFLDGKGRSFDLAALNIQRGRDHGLPSYLKWRKFCKVNLTTTVETFDDLSGTHDDASIKSLKDVYTSPDDIDLFPGALSEKSVEGGLVGPTFACLLAKQFKLLKTGDRFWFEEENDKVRFTPAQLTELRKASLSRVICDNTDTYKIQKNAFVVSSIKSSCTKIPRIDLKQWKEPDGGYCGGVRPKPIPDFERTE